MAASAGAACHAGEVDVSAVLEAMDVPLEWAMGTVRFSVGRDTTSAQIDRAAQIIAQAARRLGPQSAGPEGVRSKAHPHAGHPATLRVLGAKRALNMVRLALMDR